MPNRVAARKVVDGTLGRNVRAAREKAGWSQRRLAERLGLAKQQVQKYEAGVDRMSAATLKEIADLFEIPVEQLYP